MKSDQNNKSDNELLPEEIFFAGAALCLFVVLIFALIMFLFAVAGGN